MNLSEYDLRYVVYETGCGHYVVVDTGCGHYVVVDTASNLTPLMGALGNGLICVNKDSSSVLGYCTYPYHIRKYSMFKTKFFAARHAKKLNKIAIKRQLLESPVTIKRKVWP
jgi:hypothetical protein